MMRSLYAGVSGMRTHQTKMDVIGNNIANVNTVAYKSNSITFGELMYQTTQKASGPNGLTGGINARQIGLGVQAGAINTNIAQSGAAQTTGNPFDIKINGDSFFMVGDGANNYYTRAGAFYVDGGGNLAMTSNGYNVMGFGINDVDGTLNTEEITELRIMDPKYMDFDPEGTTRGYISGLVDKNDTEINSASGRIMNMKFYDNAGFTYTAKIAIKANANSLTTGEYTLELVDVVDSTNKSVKDQFPNLKLGDTNYIADPKKLELASGINLGAFTYTKADGTQDSPDLTNNVDLTDKNLVEALAKAYGCKSAEEFLNYRVMDGGTPPQEKAIRDLLAGGVSKIVPGGDLTKPVETVGREFTGGIVKYSTDNGKFISINGQTTATSLKLNMGNVAQFPEIEVDMRTSAMYDNKGTSTIAAFNGDTDGNGTGRKSGKLSDISIQTNGMIYASYDNGMRRLLGQIMVASFANPSGLEKIGDNMYQSSMNSGDPQVKDITSDGGSMNTGTLEMSNVDLSQEFTEMITTQRGFQANSRIITVSDTLLEELVNLKR